MKKPPARVATTRISKVVASGFHEYWAIKRGDRPIEYYRRYTGKEGQEIAHPKDVPNEVLVEAASWTKL